VLGLLIVLIPPTALLVAPDGLRESLRQGRWGYVLYFTLLGLWGTLGLFGLVLLISTLLRDAF
jgi:hypothetical protein